MDKMTKKEALNYVLKNCELPKTVADKLGSMVTALERKATTVKPTATQVENLKTRAALVEFINDNYAEGANGFTVTDLMKECDAVAGLTNQKISAILRQAFLADEVSKATIKRHTYFAPAGVYAKEVEGE